MSEAKAVGEAAIRAINDQMHVEKTRAADGVPFFRGSWTRRCAFGARTSRS
jgi:hypothetical protein